MPMRPIYTAGAVEWIRSHPVTMGSTHSQCWHGCPRRSCLTHAVVAHGYTASPGADAALGCVKVPSSEQAAVLRDHHRGHHRLRDVQPDSSLRTCLYAVTGKRLCYMNTASDEVIRSLFFNKHNQHLITVSVYSSDNYTSLRCRTTSLECVLCRDPIAVARLCRQC